MNANTSTVDGTGPGSSLALPHTLEFAGRFLMAAFFFVAGIRKLLAWGATAAYFGKIGLPMPEFILVGVLLVEMGGALMLVVGWRIRVVALALAVFALSAALLGHQFWAADPTQVNNQANHFLKVIGVLGGLLHIAAFAHRKPVPSA